MSIQFQLFEGKLEDITTQLAREADLIMEGGSGTNMALFVDFRRTGYKGPYVRMDLMYNGTTLGSPGYYKPEDGEPLTDFWDYRGNCFRPEHVEPVIERFSSQRSVFVTFTALTNALFDEDLSHWEGRKSIVDIIPIPQAVEVLSELPYGKQLHIVPAGSGILASKRYAEIHSDEFAGIQRAEHYEGVLLLGARDVYTDRFKTFIEESAKRGWKFYLPIDDCNVLYMTR